MQFMILISDLPFDRLFDLQLDTLKSLENLYEFAKFLKTSSTISRATENVGISRRTSLGGTTIIRFRRQFRDTGITLREPYFKTW